MGGATVLQPTMSAPGWRQRLAASWPFTQSRSGFFQPRALVSGAAVSYADAGFTSSATDRTIFYLDNLEIENHS